MRSPAVAAQYFTKLKTEYTNAVYKSAAMRARGLLPNVNIYEEFHVFQKTISENELYSTLTNLQLNQLLDFLVEQTID